MSRKVIVLFVVALIMCVASAIVFFSLGNQISREPTDVELQYFGFGFFFWPMLFGYWLVCDCCRYFLKELSHKRAHVSGVPGTKL